MEYTVMARRFRPQSFGEVVGQENIAQALKNAIAAQRVAHAYLFTGARGVGKTSTARILAKSLNCAHAVNGDPCNDCEICRGISVGSDVDVNEIDGASNNGVEQIRMLRANVNVKPMQSQYKIYIIDEVHMLSTAAFNALLKTLEEPPPNVKFIFCTTDPHKVPDTILSRCQRFDFGTIATSSIGQRLAEIATSEGVVVDPKAIQLVARRAAGSMRDSQSLFDQLLAFGGKTIGPQDVHRLLGTAPDERLIELGDALLNRQPAQVLSLLDDAVQGGAQVSELTDQLLTYFRDLMVLAAGAREAPLISVADEQRPALGKQSANALQTVLAGLQILAETKHRMKGAALSRVLLELALVRISTLDQLDDLRELVARMRQGQFASAGPAALAVPSVSRTIAAPPPAGTSAGTRPVAPGAENERRPISNGTGEVVSAGPASSTAAGDGRDDSQGAPSGGGDSAPLEPVEIIPFEAGRESEIWSQTLSLLTDMTKSNAKSVSRAAISGPNALVLMFQKSYHFSKQSLERSPDHVARIEKTLERVVGRPIRVTFAEDDSSPTAVVKEVRKVEQPAAKPEKAPDAERDTLVQRAISVFGATVIKTESSVAPGKNQE